MQSHPGRHRRKRQKHHLPLQQRSGGNKCSHCRRRIGIRDSRQLRRRRRTGCKRQESGYTASSKRRWQIRLRGLRTRPNQCRPNSNRPQANSADAVLPASTATSTSSRCKADNTTVRQARSTSAWSCAPTSSVNISATKKCRLKHFSDGIFNPATLPPA